MLTYEELAVIYAALDKMPSDTKNVFNDETTIFTGDLKEKIKEIATENEVLAETSILNGNTVVKFYNALKRIVDHSADSFQGEIAKKAIADEASSENRVREYYAMLSSYKETTDSVAYIDGQEFAVVHTLNLLGIKIEGVNA